MTDFVTLCKRVAMECGIAGGGPSSTIGQTGILGKIVDRTARAWINIQTSRPYWQFLRRQLSFPLIVNQQSYVISAAAPTGFGLTTMDKWDEQSSFIYDVSTADESELRWISYQKFRDQYRKLVVGRPTQCYTDRGGAVGFNRIPDKAYTITLDYWKTPELLVNPTDIAALPAQYVDVIVWKSVMMFAGNEMAPDLFNYAKSQYTPQYMELVFDQTDIPIAIKPAPLVRGSQHHRMYTGGFTK